MGLFGRLGQGAAKDTVKRLRKDPEFIKEAQGLLQSVLAPSQGGQETGGDDEGGSDSGVVATYPTAPQPRTRAPQTDIVEETLMQAMAQARADKKFDKAADLARQIQNHRRAMVRERAKSYDTDGDDGETGGDGQGTELSGLTLSLDIGNLAPHADDIASELVGMATGMGFSIPENLAATAKSLVANTIKAHPDVVKTNLDKFFGYLQTLAPAKGQQGQRPTPGSLLVDGKFDPAHPELWANREGGLTS